MWPEHSLLKVLPLCTSQYPYKPCTSATNTLYSTNMSGYSSHCYSTGFIAGTETDKNPCHNSLHSYGDRQQTTKINNALVLK